MQYKNNDGTLRDSTEVWYDVIDALGSMSNETERNAISLRLFGRSAQELNPLIEAGSDELRTLGFEAEKMGAIVKDSTVKSLGELDDEVQIMQAQFKAGTMEIAGAFTPAIKEITPLIKTSIVPAFVKLADGISSVIKWYSGLNDNQRKMVNMLALTVVGIGPVTTGIGKLTTGLGGIVGKFAGAVKAGGGFSGFLSSLIGPGGKIVLAIGAIALLTAGIMKMVDSFKPGTAEVRKLIDASDDLITKHRDSEREAGASARAANKLTSELDALRQKTNRTAAEQSRMEMIVASLTKIYPELNLEIERQSGAINLSTAEIRDFISAKKDQILLQVYEQKYTDLLTAQVDLEAQVAEQQKLRADKQAKLNDIQKNGIKLSDSWTTSTGSLTKEIFKIDQNIENLTKQIEDNNKEMQATDKQYNQVAKTYKVFSGGVSKDAASTATAVKKSMTEQGLSLEEWMKKTNDANKERIRLQEEQKKSREEYLLALETRTEQHKNTMGSIEDAGIQKTKLTAAEIKANLEQQILDWTNWRVSIQTLSKRVPIDVMTELQKLGPGMLPVLDELNGMTEKELAEWVKVWQTKSDLATNAAKDELAQMPGAAQTAGNNTTTNLGLSLAGLKSAAQGKAKDARNAAKIEFDGMATDAYAAGESAAAGIARGLKAKKQLVVNAAEDVAYSIPKRTRAVLQTASPSKVMTKIGFESPRGLAKGVLSGIGLVKSATRRMAQASIPELNNSYELGVHPNTKQALVSEDRSTGNLVEAFKTALDGMGFYIDNRKYGRLTHA